MILSVDRDETQLRQQPHRVPLTGHHTSPGALSGAPAWSACVRGAGPVPSAGQTAHARASTVPSLAGLRWPAPALFCTPVWIPAYPLETESHCFLCLETENHCYRVSHHVTQQLTRGGSGAPSSTPVLPSCQWVAETVENRFEFETVGLRLGLGRPSWMPPSCLQLGPPFRHS